MCTYDGVKVLIHLGGNISHYTEIMILSLIWGQKVLL